jgi:hypothetical protein
MKFAAHTNENAGRTVQKLPGGSGIFGGAPKAGANSVSVDGAQSSSKDAADSGSKDAGESASNGAAADAANGIAQNLAGVGAFSVSTGNGDSSAKTATGNSVRKAEVAIQTAAIEPRAVMTSDSPSRDASVATERNSVPDQTAARVEQVARMVTQEVTMLRQSGATSLAVSLKVDAHTELFVQLTSHGGQMQASLHCERGSLAGLDGHWGQLQESLARQNVQLMPLQDRNPSRNPFAGMDPDTGGSPQPGDGSPQQQPQRGDARANELLTESAGRTTRARPTTNRSSSRRGWESWA